jgi:uncharacterized membrane protein YedE/YeeE
VATVAEALKRPTIPPAALRALLWGVGVVVGWALLDAESFAFGAYWLIGIAFGVILQRSRLCFAGAFRDLILLGDGRLLRAILTGLAVATVGFAALEARLVPDPSFGVNPNGPHIQPVGIATIVGGIAFGVGMVLAGGCVSGSLWRMGEGYLASWVAMGGILAGLELANHTWAWWYDNDIRERSALWLPAELGFVPSVLVVLAGLGIAYLAVLWWESRSPRMPAVPPPTPLPPMGVREHLERAWQAVMSPQGWSYRTGAIALAVVSIIALAYQVPLGVTGGLSLWADNVAGWFGRSALPLKGSDLLAGCTPGSGGWMTVRGATVLGLVMGAFGASWLSGEFRLRWPRNPSRFAQAAVGGLLMGYASVIAIGCTIGAFFSSIPSLAVAGWVFGAGLLLGAAVGVALIKRLP